MQQPHRQAPIPTGIPAYPQVTPPPLPPRPPSESQLRLNQSSVSDPLMKTRQRIYEAPENYNPLHGVPFQINPIYSKKLNSDNESFV